MELLEISCVEVRRELSNYIEEDVKPALRDRIDVHVNRCGGCRAVYDGVRNVIRLCSGGEVLELPTGFSLRLYRRLNGTVAQ
jgi:predicted anti-sigma-YlaC factor YlaD